MHFFSVECLEVKKANYEMNENHPEIFLHGYTLELYIIEMIIKGEGILLSNQGQNFAF